MEARGLELGAVGIALAVNLVATGVLGAIGAAGYVAVGGVGATAALAEAMGSPAMRAIVVATSGSAGALGGLVAARLARHAPMLHGFALAVAVLAIALLHAAHGSGLEGAAAVTEGAGHGAAFAGALLGAACVRRAPAGDELLAVAAR